MLLHGFPSLFAAVALLVSPATAFLEARSHLRGRGSMQIGFDGDASGGNEGSVSLGSKDSESCADLLNKGSHFTVKVSVGTPAQQFELVADTGSDAVIVTSCLCVDQGYCPKNDTCFRGTNRSSTFTLTEGVNPNSTDPQASSGPLMFGMKFGSGEVTNVIGSDVVQVDGAKATMTDALLLMVDRRKLRIGGQFEGILGLGPFKSEVTSSNDKQDLVPHAGIQAGVPYTPKLFMHEAGVDRYSICFRDGGATGALRLNVPQFQQPLPSVGSFHWGLGLYGLATGKQDSPVLACGKDSMKQGQKTPCGAIPDSGTTLMMGPKDQVEALFGSLCDDWKRCREARKKDLKNQTKSHAFQTLLYQCNEWVTKDNGIDEVPSVFLTVGSPGKLQTLELTAWAYITETMQMQYKKAIKHLFGVVPVEVAVPTGKTTKVCLPSFGVMPYLTADNGPVWILGTPLYYQHTVGFGLKDKSIGFAKGKCDGCTKPSLLTKPSQEDHSHSQGRPIRTLSGEPRVPRFDTSLPL